VSRAARSCLLAGLLLAAAGVPGDERQDFLARALGFNHAWAGDYGYAVFHTSQGRFRDRDVIVIEDEAAVFDPGQALYLAHSTSYHQTDEMLTPLYGEVRIVAYPIHVPKDPQQAAEAMFLEAECRMGWNFLFERDEVTVAIAETRGLPEPQVREMKKASATPQPIGDHKPYTWGNAVLRVALHDHPPEGWVVGGSTPRKLGPFQAGEFETESGRLPCTVVQPDGNLAVTLCGGKAVRVTLRPGGWQPMRQTDDTGIAETRERLLRTAREAQAHGD